MKLVRCLYFFMRDLSKYAIVIGVVQHKTSNEVNMPKEDKAHEIHGLWEVVYEQLFLQHSKSYERKLCMGYELKSSTRVPNILKDRKEESEESKKEIEALGIVFEQKQKELQVLKPPQKSLRLIKLPSRTSQSRISQSILPQSPKKIVKSNEHNDTVGAEEMNKTPNLETTEAIQKLEKEIKELREKIAVEQWKIDFPSRWYHYIYALQNLDTPFKVIEDPTFKALEYVLKNVTLTGSSYSYGTRVLGTNDLLNSKKREIKKKIETFEELDLLWLRLKISLNPTLFQEITIIKLCKIYEIINQTSNIEEVTNKYSNKIEEYKKKIEEYEKNIKKYKKNIQETELKLLELETEKQTSPETNQKDIQKKIKELTTQRNDQVKELSEQVKELSRYEKIPELLETIPELLKTLEPPISRPHP